MTFKIRFTFLFILFCFAVSPTIVQADGVAIDKIYHPYVQPHEREIEWRMIDYDGIQKHRVGLKKSFVGNFYIEGYFIGKDTEEDSLSLTAHEVELLWQLTEQGEYSADWGVLFELEKEQHENNWEFSTGAIVEKEWGRWTGTANLYAIYEWGDTIKNELESALALQARYRYSRLFEPALEFYGGEDTRGLGPVIMGDIRVGPGKKIHWETGAIIGLDSKIPDKTWRFVAEFEF